MTILPVIALSAIALLVAYFTYAKMVCRWFGVDTQRTTPAVEFQDGNDFVPAPAPVVLGGHFTAIAAAGPVVGPIVAGLAFGWGPALLWIVLGAIFVGAVHDSGALFASLRHKASSITQVVREQMSRPAYLTFLIFVWICLVYVVIAFADITAGTFARLEQVPVTVDGVARQFSVNGGAVVIGATGYLVFSVIMGLVMRYTRIHWSVLLSLAVAGLGVVIWKSPAIAATLSGWGVPLLDLSGRSAEQLGSTRKLWDQLLLVYCFVASIVPMWLLLQPRGLIGATFLYAALFFSVVGTLIGGWTTGGSLTVQWPMFTGFTSSAGQWLFPFLFITVACGACSGFHSIVASGTTCKQIRSERDVRSVGYGSMLLEGMVAVFSLSCVMVMAPGTKAGGAEVVYARGLGNFMQFCGIPLEFAISFGLLAFSSFVFDTMDVCTRLGRYVMQEFLGVKGVAGNVTATVLTLAGPALYLWASPAGSFMQFWTIFGTSNQLLAALTLVAVALWLKRSGRRAMFAAIPAILMFATTSVALVLNLVSFWRTFGTQPQISSGLNVGIAVLLMAMSGFVAVEAVRAWVSPQPQKQAELEAVPAGK